MSILRLLPAGVPRRRRSPRTGCRSSWRASAPAPARVAADYLPQLQQELLAVIARYEKIDLSNVTVNLDRHGGGEVLELNITLPEGRSPLRAFARVLAFA